MNQAKGLSQILYLIIAASVLMIAALSMVFMLDEGLSGIVEFGGDTDVQACESAIDASCAAGSSTIDTPRSCLTTNADGEQEVIQGAATLDAGVEVDSTTCPR